MAKKGFSVGKEALFKKIMPTNQEDDLLQENIELNTDGEIEAEEKPVPEVLETAELQEVALPEVAQAEEQPLAVESEPESVLTAKPEPEVEPAPVIPPTIKVELVQTEQSAVVSTPAPESKVKTTETADEMQQKDIVRPMIYGLPEDKQPAIQQTQQPQPQQQAMPQPQMMPGQEIPMYPAPGYMQPPYPMPTPEQAAQMAATGVAYQQPYMVNGYPPQYYPMAPNPYYHPNAAFATMYYATGQDGQPQQVVLPQMVVDGAKLSLYDMLEDMPPVMNEQEEKHEAPVEPKAEQPVVEEKEEPAERWQLINVVAMLMKDKVIEFMKRDKEICQCTKCQLDVTALALNKVKPHYITAEAFSKALMELYYQEHKVDIMVAIFEAIDVVKANPRHDEE